MKKKKVAEFEDQEYEGERRSNRSSENGESDLLKGELEKVNYKLNILCGLNMQLSAKVQSVTEQNEILTANFQIMEYEKQTTSNQFEKLTIQIEKLTQIVEKLNKLLY